LLKTRVAGAASIVAIVFFVSTANAQERAGRSGSRSRVTVPASQVVNGDYFAFGGVFRVAWVRVNQFSLYVDPGPALGALSAKISPNRGHYA